MELVRTGFLGSMIFHTFGRQAAFSRFMGRWNTAPIATARSLGRHFRVLRLSVGHVRGILGSDWQA
jgi:hypothetical protein